MPTRNRASDLSALLEALAKQTRPPDEVVIVDASDPPRIDGRLADALRASPLKLKHLPIAPGAARQRNIGARQATCELLFFFDDDVIPHRSFIEIMEDTFNRHPEYHGGMGTLLPSTRRWSPASILCRLFMLQHEFGDGKFSWSGMPRHPYGTRLFRDTEIMGGGLMAVRREVFTRDKIEFDEALTLSQQDTDFSRRLSRRRRLFFNPSAVVEHTRSPLGRPDAFEQGRRYMFNFRWLYFKNFYPYARWTLPAHWWAVIGMFLVAAVTGSGETLRGYYAGFMEFWRMRRGRSEGIFESVSHPS